MQTIKPLRDGEQTIAIGGRLEQTLDDAGNPMAEDQGERLNATYMDYCLVC